MTHRRHPELSPQDPAPPAAHPGTGTSLRNLWALPGASVLAVAFGLASVPAAHADPASCTRTSNGSGDDIVCDRGVPEGETLRGTPGNDRIVLRGAVAGTVEAGDGDDEIIVTGRSGGDGGDGGNGFLGPQGDRKSVV